MSTHRQHKQTHKKHTLKKHKPHRLAQKCPNHTHTYMCTCFYTKNQFAI